MKSITETIVENIDNEDIIEESRRNPKYVIRYKIKGSGHDYMFCDHWQAMVRQEPISKAIYWDVMLMSGTSLNDPRGLVAWHGENGYWANRYENAPNNKSHSTRGNKLNQAELEIIERTRQ